MQKRARAKHFRYSLKQPKRDVQELYVKNMKQNIARNGALGKKLVKGFRKGEPVFADKLKPKRLTRVVASIAVRRVLNTALTKCRVSTGKFLATIRDVNDVQLYEEDFGEQYHMASSEPYFYDESYAPIKRKNAIPVNDKGKCVVAEEVGKKVWLQAKQRSGSKFQSANFQRLRSGRELLLSSCSLTRASFQL